MLSSPWWRRDMGSGGRGGPPTVFCVVLLVLVSTQVKKITIPFTLKNGLSCTALGCYRQYSAPHCPIFSYANFHRRAMEKKRDNLGSTWRPVQRLGGQLLTQFLTRSRRGWWVRSSGSIDLGYKLRSPQSIRPFRCLWAVWPALLFRQHLRASRSRTTQTGTHSTCARPTLISQSGSQPGRVSWRQREKNKTRPNWAR